MSYALVVLGSAGRGESLLAPDQDNAVVFADTEDVGKADAWFAALGRHIADILDEAGIPYCKGGVMAVNPEWRRTVSAWRQTVDDWLSRSRPRDLLNVDIFFDLSPVGGDLPLAEALWRAAYEAGHGNAAFAKLLAEASAGFNPPLGLLGGFRTEQGRVDLKKGGLFPIVAGARLLSIRYNVLARSTPERLAGLRDREVGAASDLDRLIDVHGLLVDVILRQQIEDIGNGLSPSNAVDPGRLSRGRQSDLKDALKSLKPIETMVRDILFGGGDG
jgi:DNA polymerase-3 subunit epsilon/CBS domain-containing protein